MSKIEAAKFRWANVDLGDLCSDEDFFRSFSDEPSDEEIVDVLRWIAVEAVRYNMDDCKVSLSSEHMKARIPFFYRDATFDNVQSFMTHALGLGDSYGDFGSDSREIKGGFADTVARFAGAWFFLCRKPGLELYEAAWIELQDIHSFGDARVLSSKQFDGGCIVDPGYDWSDFVSFVREFVSDMSRTLMECYDEDTSQV